MADLKKRKLKIVKQVPKLNTDDTSSEKKKKKLHRFPSFFAVVFFCLIIFAVFSLSYVLFFQHDDAGSVGDATAINSDLTSTAENSSNSSITPASDANFLNVLVIGAAEENNDAGCFLLLCFDGRKNLIPVVTLPVETIAEYDNKTATLAEFYKYGGEKYVTKVVADLFDIKLDKYVYFSAVKAQKVLLSIGDITVDVPEDIDYKNEEQEIFIKFKQGPQILDGSSLISLVRFKDYTGGNSQHIEMVTNVMCSIINQHLNIDRMEDFDSLFDSCINYSKSNFSFADYFNYSPLLKHLAQANHDKQIAAPVFLKGDYETANDSKQFISSSKDISVIKTSFSPGI